MGSDLTFPLIKSLNNVSWFKRLRTRESSDEVAVCELVSMAVVSFEQKEVLINRALIKMHKCFIFVYLIYHQISIKT